MRHSSCSSFSKLFYGHFIFAMAAVFVSLPLKAAPQPKNLPKTCAYILMNHLNEVSEHQLSELADLNASLNAKSNGEGEAMVLAVLSGVHPQIMSGLQNLDVKVTLLPQDKYIYQTLVSLSGSASEVKKAAEVIAQSSGGKDLRFYTLLSRRPDFNLEAVAPEEITSLLMSGKGSRVNRIFEDMQAPGAKSEAIWFKGTTDIFFVFTASDQTSQEAVRGALAISNEIATVSVEASVPAQKWLGDNLKRLTSENLVIQWGDVLVVSQAALKEIHNLKETSGQIEVAPTVPESLGQMLTDYFNGKIVKRPAKPAAKVEVASEPVIEMPAPVVPEPEVVSESVPEVVVLDRSAGLSSSENRDRAIRILRKKAPIGVAVGSEIGRNYGLRKLILEAFKKVVPSKDYKDIEQKIMDLGFAATAGTSLGRTKNATEAFTQAWDLFIEKVTSLKFADPYSEEAFAAVEDALSGKKKKSVETPSERGGFKAAMIRARDGAPKAETTPDPKPKSEPEPAPPAEQPLLGAEEGRAILKVLRESLPKREFISKDLKHAFVHLSSRYWDSNDIPGILGELQSIAFVKTDYQMLMEIGNKKSLLRLEKAWRILSDLVDRKAGAQITSEQIESVRAALSPRRDEPLKMPVSESPVAETAVAETAVEAAADVVATSETVRESKKGLDREMMRSMMAVLRKNMRLGSLTQVGPNRAFLDTMSFLWTKENKNEAMTQLTELKISKNDYQILTGAANGKKAVERFEKAWRILSHLAGYTPGFEINMAQIQEIESRLDKARGVGVAVKEVPKAESLEVAEASETPQKTQRGLDAVKIGMIIKVLRQYIPGNKIGEISLQKAFTLTASRLTDEQNPESLAEKFAVVEFTKTDYDMLSRKNIGKKAAERLEKAWRILSELAGNEPGFEITPKQIDEVNRLLKNPAARVVKPAEAKPPRVASMTDWENAVWSLIAEEPLKGKSEKEEIAILHRIAKALDTGVMPYTESHLQLAQDWLAYDKGALKVSDKAINAVGDVAGVLLRLRSSAKALPVKDRPEVSDEVLDPTRLEDPAHFPVPNRRYGFTLQNGGPHHVVFSESVIKDLFEDRDVRSLYASRFYKAIAKGFVGPTGQQGIKWLDGLGDKFIEVKIHGGVRLLGCVQGNSIKIKRYIVKAARLVRYQETCN